MLSSTKQVIAFQDRATARHKRISTLNNTSKIDRRRIQSSIENFERARSQKSRLTLTD